MVRGISLEQAWELIRSHTPLLGTETVLPSQALGRVLAEDVCSPIDQPPFPRSPLDGYALIAFDTLGASNNAPARLRVIDTVYAGGWSNAKVGPGQAVRIMTGAPIPKGADCVIRQEDTDLGDEVVSVYKIVHHHDNYCFAGEDFRAGDRLLAAGTVLNAAAMAVLASAGIGDGNCTLTVRKKPAIAVLCTGDELVTQDVSPLPKGKIYTSNFAFLISRLRELGFEVQSDGRQWEDSPELVAEAIHEALKTADAVITTGAVSVGEKDIFHEVLPLLGAEQIFWRVMIKPGTPAMFSLVDGKPVLNLSGNPFAAIATFELLGRTMLAGLSGNAGLELQPLKAELGTDFPKKSGVRRFVRATLSGGKVLLPEGHSSGELRSTAGTNCLAEFPAGSGGHIEGELVTIYLL